MSDIITNTTNTNDCKVFKVYLSKYTATTISTVNGINVTDALNNLQNSKLDKGTYTGNAQDLKNSIDSKLNKPTTTSNTTSYPFVVGEDGNGNSARLPAGDLGKNFFNSDLSNTTARNHTMNAGVTVNTLGNPHTLSGLPNKNADIANFRKVRVQNTSGLDSVVDSKNILIDMPSQLSDTEKTSWKTQMNGGWTTATMSVSSILPPFIDKSKNYNTFITLNGANLNLNPASFSVEILDLSNNVVVTIPNSQVQLNSVGTSITFYYNFNSIPLGNYKVRLWNGVAYYISSLTLNVVATLNNIDLSSAVWQKQELELGKLTTSNNSLTGNLQSTTNFSTTPFLAGLLNIPNLTLNDDFIISCTFLGLGGHSSSNTINAAFGLSTSLNITGIVNAISYGVNVRQYQTKASAAIVGGSGQTAPLNTNLNTSFAFDLIISKSGNLLNIAILNPNSGSPVISTVTITPSSQPISLAFFGECNGNQAYTTSFNTVNVIKIN